MKPKGSQFHPSRDGRPGHAYEYELPYGGNTGATKGVNFSPGGYYDTEDLKHSGDYWRAEGADSDPKIKAEAGGVMNYAQGRLFDPEKHEAANRQKLGRERFEAMDSLAADVRNEALQSSTIPTSHLQARPGRKEYTELETHNEGKGWAGSGMSGWYRGPAMSNKADVIGIDPNSGHGRSNTFIHEAGHRRHLGEQVPGTDYYSHPRRMQMDPLKEGVADAYPDRYGGSDDAQVREMSKDIEAGRGKFASYQYTGGYSTDPKRSAERGWNDSDRALYAVTRAHASETGEQALYVPRGRDVRESPGIATDAGGDPTVDATIHSLLSAGPHAAQALRQTGLKDVGARAWRRHQDRQLLSEGQSVQGSLFEEVRGLASNKMLGYTPSPDAMAENVPFRQRVKSLTEDLDRVEAAHGEMVWPVNMSRNQFGEKPRTQADVNESLGVHRKHAERLGFPAF